MRAPTDGTPFVPSSGLSPRPNARWLQAGFGSFAYRLAHPALSRATVLPMLFLLFYLG